MLTAPWRSGNQLVWIGIEALSLVVIPLDISWFVRAIGLANWSPPPQTPPPAWAVPARADERKQRSVGFTAHCAIQWSLLAGRQAGASSHLALSGNQEVPT